jgi:hypothetical protein
VFCSSFFRHIASGTVVLLSPVGRGSPPPPPLVSDADEEEQDRSMFVAGAVLSIAIDPGARQLICFCWRCRSVDRSSTCGLQDILICWLNPAYK